MDPAIWWLIAILFLLFTLNWYWNVPKHLPPGSCGLPILGYMPFISKDVHQSFLNLGKKFGNVFYLYLGNRLVVILNDYEAIREAFIKQAYIFAGRPPDALFKEREEDNLGVLATDGDYWKQHRRFILTNLRDYGVGKLILEPLLLNELQFCLKEIRKSAGKSLAIKPILSNSIANNIHLLVTGKRYDYDHPVMKRLFVLMKQAENEVEELNLLMFFPWMAYLPGIDFLTKRKTIRKIIHNFLDVIEGIVKSVKDEHKEGLRENFVHAFMTERELRKDTNKTENVFTDTGLLHVTRDLILAGTETSASTLHWALLYMTKYPDIQKKVQTEIDRVIGREREPSFRDRVNMPYTEATILELHRVVSLLPLGLPHRNIKDTNVFGNFIPKNALIIPNFWAVHHDPKIWKDPENFRPERFLDKNEEPNKSEFVVAFSIGKRACAGEPLARMEVFLYLVSLLQNFDFVPPDGIIPSLERIKSPVTRPKFQNVCAIPRT